MTVPNEGCGVQCVNISQQTGIELIAAACFKLDALFGNAPALAPGFLALVG